jgi:hypothetical protein
MGLWMGYEAGYVGDACWASGQPQQRVSSHSLRGGLQLSRLSLQRVHARTQCAHGARDVGVSRGALRVPRACSRVEWAASAEARGSAVAMLAQARATHEVEEARTHGSCRLRGCVDRPAASALPAAREAAPAPSRGLTAARPAVLPR